MNASSDTLQIAAAVVAEADRAETSKRLVETVAGALGGRGADVCILFASAHFEQEIDDIARDIHERLGPRVFIGATAEAVLCGAREYENQPAVTLWAAHLPDARAVSFHLSQDDVERLDSPEALREHLRVPLDEDPFFILLGDPFSVNTLELLERLGAAYPQRPVIGGMASGGDAPGQNRLVFDGHTLRHGMVGLALWGDIDLEPIVSQGCRPIGRHRVITKADGNVIYELGGKKALTAVDAVLKECPPQDLELARHGLLLGVVINEYQGSFSRGDFLIRNLIGFDRDSGAMAVNDRVRIGQTIQFHVRDADAASEDLQSLLRAARPEPAAGALLFSCNGRGLRLFPQRDHDASAVIAARGALPLAGCFCAGEIGPVGGRNFLHGHTLSVGLVRSASARRDE